jgi:hypothetical protein
MILVQLTNGFGNNLFQYNAGKLLGEFHKTEVIAIPPYPEYYAISDLKNLGVKFKDKDTTGPSIEVNDNNYVNCFNKNLSTHNFILSGYFENYIYYKSNIEMIKSWYPKVEKRNDNDLVIHFRAGDRLFYKNEFDSKPQVSSYLKAIEKFDFDRLHIVTDMPKWDYIDKDSISSMKFHLSVPENERVSIDLSVKYFNSFIDGFSKFNPVTKKRNVGDDFNFMRQFDNILFQHGTLGWWAAALSEAKKVGVYGPWRPWKKSSNKNLSNVGFSGWFKWE